MTLMMPNVLMNSQPTERFPLTIRYYCLHLSPTTLIDLRIYHWRPIFFRASPSLMFVIQSVFPAIHSTVVFSLVLTCLTFHHSIE